MKFKLLVLLVTVNTGLVTAGAQNLTLNIAEKYYQEGKEMLVQGNYEKANEAFKKSEAILEQLNISGRTIGQETEGKTKPKKVEGEKAGIIKVCAGKNIGDKFEEGIVQKAYESYAKGELEQAEKLYNDALKIYPRNYDISYNLGVIYLKKSEYLKAAEMFETAVSINPRDADAYYNLGVLYENFLDGQDKALKYYGKYLRYSRDKKEKQLVESWIGYINSQRAE